MNMFPSSHHAPPPSTPQHHHQNHHYAFPHQNVANFYSFYPSPGFDISQGFWPPNKWPIGCPPPPPLTVPSTNECSASVDERGDGEEEAGGRKKRNLFRPDVVQLLERTYRASHFINAKQRVELAQKCGLRADQVKIWFQNRRYKQRKKDKDVEFMTKRTTAVKEEEAPGPMPIAQQSPEKPKCRHLFNNRVDH